MGDGRGGKAFDVAIVGAGVLGVSVAYWLSSLYECSVALIDQAPGVAFHTSSRNTGVVHRPFYLDPKTKRVFAASAELSYQMWKGLARRFGLPWKEVGTLEVAVREEDVPALERYLSWGEENGMAKEELGLLDPGAVARLEPEVACRGAIHSKTDVSVDFGSFTKAVFRMAEAQGAELIAGSPVRSVYSRPDGSVELTLGAAGSSRSVRCGFLVNAAGGGAVDIAHMMGVGMGYTDLHFRGDYWVVDEPFASRVGRNIYSVARHSRFPFLDPHFVVRADGSRQIGPNAALVGGPFEYGGMWRGLVQKAFEVPVGPKVRLASDPGFLSMVLAEWRSSVFKGAMCGRVEMFLPSLSPKSLSRRGLSGVRSSVIDRDGFVPEALQLVGPSSFHILNFNSPGATGAPVFSALVVERLRSSGLLGGLRQKAAGEAPLWDHGKLLDRLGKLGLLRS